MNSYFLYSSALFLSICSLISLSLINVHFCKTVSFYRIFTINSTVCSNISLSESFLEKTFTSILLSFGCFIVHDIKHFFQLFFSKHDSKENERNYCTAPV